MCDANDSWKTTDGPAALSLKESMAHTTILYEVFLFSGEANNDVSSQSLL